MPSNFSICLFLNKLTYFWKFSIKLFITEGEWILEISILCEGV